MSSIPDGGGCRLIARDGGVFDFGDAPSYGSAGSIRLNRPIVGGIEDNGTGGYWLVVSDGGYSLIKRPSMGRWAAGTRSAA